MKCEKCGGAMVMETYYDSKSCLSQRIFEGYRCIMCCTIMDPIIYRNKFKPVVYTSQTRPRASTLKPKDRALLHASRVVSYLEYMEKIGTYECFFLLGSHFPILVLLYILRRTTTPLTRPQLEACIAGAQKGDVYRAMDRVPVVMKENRQIRQTINFLIAGILKTC